MLKIGIRSTIAASTLVRNLSCRAAVCTKSFSCHSDHNVSLLFRNNHGYWASCSGVRHISSKKHVIEMRGLDPETTEEEVLGFFRSLNLRPANINLHCDRSGRVAGTCVVEFSTYSEAATAMRKRNSFIGNRFVRLKLKTADVSDESGGTLKIENHQNTGDSSMHHGSYTLTKNLLSTGHLIHIKGLPHRTTEQAIFDFFWPVNVRPISVKRVCGSDGRPTTEFNVEFLTHEEAVRAMSKNNAYFGRQFVELTLNSIGNTPQGGRDQTANQISDDGYSCTFENETAGLSKI